MRQPKTRTEEEQMIKKYYNFLTARQNQHVWERIFLRVKYNLEDEKEKQRQRRSRPRCTTCGSKLGT